MVLFLLYILKNNEINYKKDYNDKGIPLHQGLN